MTAVMIAVLSDFNIFLGRTLCVGGNGSGKDHTAASFSSEPCPGSDISRSCLALCDRGVQAMRVWLSQILFNSV
jgi:hypothetical protein